MGKKKKKTQQLPQGAYKKYLNDLQQTLQIMGLDYKIADLPNEMKHMLFDYKIIINNPVICNDDISRKELQVITEKEQYYYRHGLNDLKDCKLSTYQLHLFYCFIAVKRNIKEKQIKDKTNIEVLNLKDAADKAFHSFSITFMINYFNIITQLCSPDYKYFSVLIRPAAIFKENPKMELVIELYGFPARKCMLNIHGIYRPAFRIAKPLGNVQHIEWLSVDRSVVGDFYTGDRDKMEVYIQSHALHRLSERIDMLGKEALNYVLWKNTNSEFQFIRYRNYLLLPFSVHEIKVGYLVANIVDDKLLFSTFLFITHNCTPEGDRLKKITGLTKQEICYWKIDRLSTFMKLNEEKYPGLIKLFDDAGLGDLKELRHKELDIDSLQDGNFDDLVTYMSKSKSKPRSYVVS